MPQIVYGIMIDHTFYDDLDEAKAFMKAQPEFSRWAN